MEALVVEISGLSIEDKMTRPCRLPSLLCWAKLMPLTRCTFTGFFRSCVMCDSVDQSESNRPASSPKLNGSFIFCSNPFPMHEIRICS